MAPHGACGRCGEHAAAGIRDEQALAPFAPNASGEHHAPRREAVLGERERRLRQAVRVQQRDICPLVGVNHAGKQLGPGIKRHDDDAIFVGDAVRRGQHMPRRRDGEAGTGPARDAVRVHRHDLNEALLQRRRVQLRVDGRGCGEDGERGKGVAHVACARLASHVGCAGAERRRQSSTSGQSKSCEQNAWNRSVVSPTSIIAPEATSTVPMTTSPSR